MTDHRNAEDARAPCPVIAAAAETTTGNRMKKKKE